MFHVSNEGGTMHQFKQFVDRIQEYRKCILDVFTGETFFFYFLAKRNSNSILHVSEERGTMSKKSWTECKSIASAFWMFLQERHLFVSSLPKGISNSIFHVSEERGTQSTKSWTEYKSIGSAFWMFLQERHFLLVPCQKQFM